MMDTSIENILIKKMNPTKDGIELLLESKNQEIFLMVTEIKRCKFLFFENL